MRNDEAKQILSAYRPGGEDAQDPVFREAMDQARRDPHLAEWFREQRQHDAELARIFQSLPVPEDARRSLLALPRGRTVRRKRPMWQWTTALAACFGLFLGGMVLFSHLRPVSEVAQVAERSLGAPELLEMAHAAKPLDYHGGSVAELTAWLNGRGAPVPSELSSSFNALTAVGCRVLSDDRGNAISLLCFEKDGELVHLLIADGEARKALAMVEKQWISHDGWNAYCWGDEDQDRTYVLISPAPPESLAELII